jgi:ribosome-binding factor A
MIGILIHIQKQMMRSQRKTMQLCHQVAETLNYVLSGECDDEVLQALQVIEVRPAPDDTQLLVIVAPVLPDETLDPIDVMGRLNSVSGWLRSEVARAITRKRAPRLMFQILRATPILELPDSN